MNQSVQISLYHDLKLQEFVQLLTVCQMPTCLFALCLSVPELVAEFVVVGSDTSCVADKSSVCMVFGPIFPSTLGQFSSSYRYKSQNIGSRIFLTPNSIAFGFVLELWC